jgi:hypothetical protein
MDLIHTVSDLYYKVPTASAVYWSEFLAADPEAQGYIPGSTRFSKKLWVWNGVHLASCG